MKLSLAAAMGLSGWLSSKEPPYMMHERKTIKGTTRRPVEIKYHPFRPKPSKYDGAALRKIRAPK